MPTAIESNSTVNYKQENIFVVLYLQNYAAKTLPQIFRLFRMAKISLLISSHLQKYLPNFPTKRLSELKISDLQISFDHPRYLKSQVPPIGRTKLPKSHFLINQQLCLIDAGILVQLFCLCSCYHGHHHHCHHHHHHHHHPGSNFHQNRHE